MTSSPMPATGRRVNRAEAGLTRWAALVFVILWVGFAIVLAWDESKLDDLWQWVRDLPLGVELVVWALFLPITVGLWIWQADWSQLARLAGLGAIIAWTLASLSSLSKLLRRS